MRQYRSWPHGGIGGDNRGSVRSPTLHGGDHLKIIDFECKGNMVRFYLGKESELNYHGDDWNDAPYDRRGGTVYEEYITGTADLVFPFDALVLEPCSEDFDCRFCKAWLKQLPVVETVLDGKPYFYIDSALPSGELPACLFLAGFDQLMLGYEKTESLFLPKEHMREIFNLAGIVRPAILVNGTVVGWWNLKNRKLKITLFSPADQKLISDTATRLWSDLKQIEYL